MLSKLKNIWCAIRHLSGDDAYEQYLKHFAEVHANKIEFDEFLFKPLSREDFFKDWQEKKWNSIKRCC